MLKKSTVMYSAYLLLLLMFCNGNGMENTVEIYTMEQKYIDTLPEEVRQQVAYYLYTPIEQILHNNNNENASIGELTRAAKKDIDNICALPFFTDSNLKDLFIPLKEKFRIINALRCSVFSSVRIADISFKIWLKNPYLCSFSCTYDETIGYEFRFVFHDKEWIACLIGQHNRKRPTETIDKLLGEKDYLFNKLTYCARKQPINQQEIVTYLRQYYAFLRLIRRTSSNIELFLYSAIDQKGRSVALEKSEKPVKAPLYPVEDLGNEIITIRLKREKISSDDFITFLLTRIATPVNTIDDTDALLLTNPFFGKILLYLFSVYLFPMAIDQALFQSNKQTVGQVAQQVKDLIHTNVLPLIFLSNKTITKIFSPYAGALKEQCTMIKQLENSIFKSIHLPLPQVPNFDLISHEKFSNINSIYSHCALRIKNGEWNFTFTVPPSIAENIITTGDKNTFKKLAYALSNWVSTQQIDVHLHQYFQLLIWLMYRNNQNEARITINACGKILKINVKDGAYYSNVISIIPFEPASTIPQNENEINFTFTGIDKKTVHDTFMAFILTEFIWNPN